MELDDFGTEIPNSLEGNVVGLLKEASDEEDEDKNKSGDLCQWQVLPDNQYCASSATTTIIKSGMYSVFKRHGMIIFSLRNIFSDSFIVFKDSQLDNILKDINEFWNLKNKFSEYGFVHRRGILLYGPSGSGKSILVKQAVDQIINRKGIVIDGTNSTIDNISEAVSVLRKIEPDRELIIIFEDIDAYIRKYGEAELLSFLDGEDSSKNLLCIATTNYPEKLDKRIVSRPRRFDRIIKIDMPTEEMRRTYFEAKLKINGDELTKYVSSSKGFSFAAMTELVISTKCFNKDFEETLCLLKNITGKKTSSDEYYSEKLGFGE